MAEKEFGDQNESDRDRASPVMAGSSTSYPSLAGRDRRLVLVVDDNRDCADSLQVLLSTFGYEVHVAYEGYTAMKMFNATPFGIVLLDIAMPGMHGLELARRLRRSTSPCPSIIAISGRADARTKEQAREAGIDRYVVKPVEIDELQQLLAGVGR
jgi:DNA-binding response OmpR family regulator